MGELDVPGLLGSDMPPRPMEPDEYLEASRSALARGDAKKATALAVQGSLRLQIIQHLQMHDMIAKADAARSISQEQEPDGRHLLGECEEGHEFFEQHCDACVRQRNDEAEYTDDTVEVSDEFKDKGSSE